MKAPFAPVLLAPVLLACAFAAGAHPRPATDEAPPPRGALAAVRDIASSWGYLFHPCTGNYLAPPAPAADGRQPRAPREKRPSP